MRALIRDSRGVSNIIGALLLVAITIVAAAGFAIMVSQIQKAEMERQSLLDAVKGEKLQIMSISPTLNGSRISRLDLSVLNLDARESRVNAVLVNGRPASNFSSFDEAGNEANHTYYMPLEIPAGRSRLLSVNFSKNYPSQYNVSSAEPLEVTLITSRANNFKKVFFPPTAVAGVEITTEDLGIADRDVLILDGSKSFDDGSILGYRWTISNGTKSSNMTGKSVRVIFDQTGPFYVNLTVLDDVGMSGVSDNILIPRNANFDPPVRMETPSASYTAGNNIIVSVKDVVNRPVVGVGVYFLRMAGNVNLTTAFGVTNSSGIASTTVVSGTGIIEVLSGRLNPIDVQVT